MMENLSQLANKKLNQIKDILNTNIISLSMNEYVMIDGQDV